MTREKISLPIFKKQSEACPVPNYLSKEGPKALSNMHNDEQRKIIIKCPSYSIASHANYSNQTNSLSGNPMAEEGCLGTWTL